jgi:hypothetical protein
MKRQSLYAQPDKHVSHRHGGGLRHARLGDDGGPAITAHLNGAPNVAVDASGSPCISDGLNHRIRNLTPARVIATVAGTGTPDFSGAAQ